VCTLKEAMVIVFTTKYTRKGSGKRQKRLELGKGFSFFNGTTARKTFSIIVFFHFFIVSMRKISYPACTVTEGVALPSDPSSYMLSIQKVPLKVTPKNNPASYDFVDDSVRVGSFDKNVAEPYGGTLASKVRQEAFGVILGGATNAFVAASIADFKFSLLSNAIAAIEDSNMGGKTNGVLSNTMKAIVTNSGLNQFQNSSVAFELWKGKIQNFNGVDFISQSEICKFKAPAAITGGTVTTPPVEGGETIGVTFTGISAVTEIPAGYVFTVANVNAVDIFKKDNNRPRAFVVLPEISTDPDGLVIYTNPVTNASGVATLRIAPIYVTNKALKNATALPATGAAINLLLTSGTNYQTGAIFNKNSVGYASAAIKAPPGTDSSTSTIEGFVNVRMTAQYQITKGLNIVRFDILTGGKALYPQGIAGLWVPAA